MWKLGLAVLGAMTLALSGTALAASGQQISVNGTGGAVVPAGATNSQQQASYDQALTAAIADAKTKAQIVASQLSLTLGAVQTVTEQSDDYLGYCGVGFLPAAGAATGVSGSASAPTASRAPSGQLTPIPGKHKKHKAKKKARKAQSEENSCQVQAAVTVVYAAG